MKTEPKEEGRIVDRDDPNFSTSEQLYTQNETDSCNDLNSFFLEAYEQTGGF